MSLPKKKVAVLISGRGSNLQALLDACAAPDYPAEIVLVISNVPGVYGLERAERAGVPHQVIRHKDYPDRESFDRAMDHAIDAAGAELICLAGFMRLLSPWFAGKWDLRMINIHPALLPSYKGLHTHQRVLEDGTRLHGATVHFVTADLDAGPVIIQGAVPVLDDDTEDSLAARVLTVEHRLFPEALRLVAAGLTRLDGRRVLVGSTGSNPAQSNPRLIVPDLSA